MRNNGHTRDSSSDHKTSEDKDYSTANEDQDPSRAKSENRNQDPSGAESENENPPVPPAKWVEKEIVKKTTTENFP